MLPQPDHASVTRAQDALRLRSPLLFGNLCMLPSFARVHRTREMRQETARLEALAEGAVIVLQRTR